MGKFLGKFRFWEGKSSHSLKVASTAAKNVFDDLQPVVCESNEALFEALRRHYAEGWPFIGVFKSKETKMGQKAQNAELFKFC